jgi:hypothetical protein
MSTSGYGQEGFTDYEDQINWDTVGSPVPVGDYDAVVEKAEYAPTKAGKHMAKVQFKIESAYQPENEEKGVNRLIFENLPFTQEAGFRVKSFAQESGIELPMMVNKGVVEEWCAGIVGVKVGISIKHREYNGSMQASVSKFFPYQNAPGTLPAVDQQAEEQQAEEQAAQEQPAPAPAPAPKQAAAPAQSTLRQAVAPKTQTNGTHKANGTNGSAKPAAKTATNKPQTQRR